MLSYPWKFHETGPVYITISKRKDMQKIMKTRVYTLTRVHTYSAYVHMHTYTLEQIHKFMQRERERESAREKKRERARKREIDG